MTDFQYDPRSSRYRDLKSGRFLSRSTVTTIRDVFSERVKAELGKATQSYLSGKLTPGEWQAAMRGNIKNAHLASYALGRGGVKQMTKADYGRVGAALKAEYKALGQFAAKLPTMTPDAITTRANLYAETAIGGYERGRVQALKQAGAKGQIWHTAGDEKVCPECAPRDGKTYPLNDSDIPPLHPNCRCWMEPA